MKQMLLGGLCIVAFASSAFAQQLSLPDQLPAAVNGPGDTTVTGVSHRFSESGPGCAVPLKTICVPECTTKVTVKPSYSKVCEPLCLPKCSSLFGRFGQCQEDCANCERPRNKYYLVVRPCKEERQ